MTKRFIHTRYAFDLATKLGFKLSPATRVWTMDCDVHSKDVVYSQDGFVFDSDLSRKQLRKLGLMVSALSRDVFDLH